MWTVPAPVTMRHEIYKPHVPVVSSASQNRNRVMLTLICDGRNTYVCCQYSSEWAFSQEALKTAANNWVIYNLLSSYLLSAKNRCCRRYESLDGIPAICLLKLCA